MKNLKITLSGAVAAASLLLAANGVLAQPSIPVVNDTPIENPNTIPDSFPIPEIFDEKVMPGIACEAQQGVHVSSLDRIAHPETGSYLENPVSPGVGGRARSVKCPIVRDNTTNIDGTFSAAVTIYNPNDALFICILDSYDEFGVWLDSVSRSTFVAGDQTLTLEPGPGDLTVSESNGFYVLRCTLPDEGRIYSYRWAEYLRTDLNN